MPVPRPSSIRSGAGLTPGRPAGQLATGLWIIFILWTILIAVIWLGDIGEAELRRWLGGVQTTDAGEREAHPELFGALRLLLGWADPVWIVLAAANTYASVAARGGLGVARRRALIALSVFWLALALSAWTTWPMGAVHFTGRLGFKLGPVPIGWVLLLFVLATGAHRLAGTLARSASHFSTSLLAGVLLGIAILPLSLAAWKIRAWLIWYPGVVPAPANPPIQCVLTFLFLGFSLAWLSREASVVRSGASDPGKPAAIFVIIVALLGASLAMALP
jgi:hypothetical protein